MTVHTVTVGDINFANDRPLVLISGPCQIELRAHAFMMAERLKAATAKAGVPFIFKSSYDKANRTSVSASAASASRRACASSPTSAMPSAARC